MLAALVALMAVQITPHCELTPTEQARSEAALERVVSEGDRSAMYYMTPTGRPGGCGIWLLTVEPDGSVSAAVLQRHESTGEYEQSIGRYLLTRRFEPSDQRWEALAPVMIYPPRN